MIVVNEKRKQFYATNASIILLLKKCCKAVYMKAIKMNLLDAKKYCWVAVTNAMIFYL